MSDPSASAPSPLALWAGMAGAAVLMLGALGIFYLSLGSKSATDTADTHQITIDASGCTPNTLTVPAGAQRFTVINESERAIEWEILDGVMVLEERENIAPGLHQQLTARLLPGEYQMTCGLLSNPRGTLTVTAVAGQTVAADLSARALIGPLAEYRVYLTLEGRALARAVGDLQQQIADDNLDAAQQAWLQARAIDQHMALAVGLFSDLDQRLNARAEYFAEREQDADFRGFERLAYGLFEQQSTAGLLPVVKQLSADVGALRSRLSAQGVPASQLANGAGRVLQAWHDQQQNSEQLSSRARSDLQGLQAGIDKVVSLLLPVLQQAHPQESEALQAANASLAEQVPDADTQTLLQASQQLADQLASVNALLASAY
ncbi:cupredoxin domain-containing protein [Halopseudomonas oceani]|nr:cupredoxin domain-containing protein [Halopseudomonas oceani]